MNSSAAAAAAVAVAATGAVVAATAAELRFNWDVRGAAALPQLDYMEDGYDLSFMSEANVICRNCIKLCMVYVYYDIRTIVEFFSCNVVNTTASKNEFLF